MFKSLKTKLLFYVLITNLIIFLGFGFFIYTTAKKGAMNTLDTQLKIISLDAIMDLKGEKHIEAKVLCDDLIHEFDIKPLYAKIIYFNTLNNTIEYESISSKKVKHLFEIPLHENAPFRSIYYFDKGQHMVSSMLLYKEKNIKIFFQLAIDKRVEYPHLKRLLLSLFIGLPVVLIVILILSNFLIDKILYPVKDVINSVKTISSNHLKTRIDTKNVPSEIAELIDTFNTLLKNLENSFERISLFSSSASHELKTPLTIIRGEVEIGLRKDRTQKYYKDILSNILQEVIGVQESIEQLFFITKQDTQEFRKNFEELYLDELITDVISQVQKSASTKNIEIKLLQNTPLTIYANEILLKTAFINILNNSISYSPKNAEIRVLLYKKDKEMFLEIQDDGCGIKEDEVKFVFDSFYRAKNAKEHKEKGSGLGLAIVKIIFDIHKYNINLISKEGIGTKFIVKINLD
jgi:signal transduction histidine kinase